MEKKTLFRIISVAVCAAVLAACGGKGPGSEPENSKATKLTVSGGSTVNADVTAYDLTVTCDGTWSAQVSEGSAWAKVTTDKTATGGTVHVSMDINESEDIRTAEISVTAGSLSQKARITQKAISSIISRKILQFDAKGEQTLTLTTQSPWTAEITGAPSWLTVDPVSGAAGTTNVKVSVLEDNKDKGSRTATVLFTIGGKTLSVQVIEGQTNFLESESDRVYKYDQTGGTLELKTRTNVGRPYVKLDFKAGDNQGAESPGIWIKHLSTKAADEHTHSFTITENDKTYTREADIIFFIEDVADTVTISQKGIDPLIRTNAIGAYDIQGESWLYRTGNDMLSRLYSADGKTLSMRIVNAADITVISVTGIAVDAKVGDTFTVGFSYFQSGKTLLEKSCPVTVLKVGESGEEAGLLWLREEDGAGFIIKK